MNLHEQTIWNKAGKRLAPTLSRLVASSVCERFSRMAEAYWCVLLGKGAGTGWALSAEVKAAQSVICRPSPLLFDVGANNGEWAASMKHLYPDAQMFLFEPQRQCQSAIWARNLPGAVLIPDAVSSRSGETMKLFVSGEDSGLASLHQRKDSYFSDRAFTSLDVSTVAIDDVIRERGISCVDFMKVDVEGHELAVLEGAKKSLKGGVIKALAFEFGSGNINSRTFFRDFWDLLVPMGYEIYRILPSSRLMRIHEYYEDCEYFRGVTNYIAVRL